MATWPAGLPQFPLVGSFEEGQPDDRYEFAVDKGKPMTRDKGAAATPARCAMMLTSAQADIFDTYYGGALKDDGWVIDWVHPRTGAAARWYLQTKHLAEVTINAHRLTMDLLRLP